MLKDSIRRGEGWPGTSAASRYSVALRCHVRDIAVAQCAHASCRRAWISEREQNFLPFGMRRLTMLFLAHFGVIHDAGLHADQNSTRMVQACRTAMCPTDTESPTLTDRLDAHALRPGPGY